MERKDKSGKDLKAFKVRPIHELPGLPCSSSSKTRLWENFGIEIHDQCRTKTGMVVRLFTDLLERASNDCGIPVYGSKGKLRSTMHLIMQPLLGRLPWNEMTEECRSEISIGFNKKSRTENVQSVQKKALDVACTITRRLNMLTNPAARGMKKAPRHQHGGGCSESDYDGLVLNLLSCFFRSQMENKHARQACLYTTHHIAERADVSCDIHLACASVVQAAGREFYGYLSLVIGMNHKPLSSLEAEEAAFHCSLDTINQHVRQLLTCIQDSLFSRHWHLYKNGDIPTSNRVYIFGAIIHRTKFQLTCLEASKEHLSKITRRPHTVDFSSEEIQTSEISESDNGPMSKKVKCEEGSRSPSPTDDGHQNAILYISKPVYLENMFMSGPDNTDFLELMEFLDTLQRCAFYVSPEEQN